MKKSFASFAVLIYFTFATGVIVNCHYCMDRYDSFRLYKAASDYCTKCGMHTKKNKCCHDDVKVVKLQDDHQFSSISFSLKNLQPEIILLADFRVSDPDSKLFYSDYLNHSPPLLKGQDIHLLNSVFRI